MPRQPVLHKHSGFCAFRANRDGFRTGSVRITGLSAGWRVALRRPAPPATCGPGPCRVSAPSRDEVTLNATTCLKHQAALSVAYGAGLRVAEAAALKVSDIDSERMLLRVERGKGGRYRDAIRPADLLTLLREWWKAGPQQGLMHAQG